MDGGDGVEILGEDGTISRDRWGIADGPPSSSPWWRSFDSLEADLVWVRGGVVAAMLGGSNWSS